MSARLLKQRQSTGAAAGADTATCVRTTSEVATLYARAVTGAGALTGMSTMAGEGTGADKTTNADTMTDVCMTAGAVTLEMNQHRVNA